MDTQWSTGNNSLLNLIYSVLGFFLPYVSGYGRLLRKPAVSMPHYTEDSDKHTCSIWTYFDQGQRLG